MAVGADNHVSFLDIEALEYLEEASIVDHEGEVGYEEGSLGRLSIGVARPSIAEGVGAARGTTRAESSKLAGALALALKLALNLALLGQALGLTLRLTLSGIGRGLLGSLALRLVEASLVAVVAAGPAESTAGPVVVARGSLGNGALSLALNLTLKWLLGLGLALDGLGSGGELLRGCTRGAVLEEAWSTGSAEVGARGALSCIEVTGAGYFYIDGTPIDFLLVEGGDSLIRIFWLVELNETVSKRARAACDDVGSLDGETGLLEGFG